MANIFIPIALVFAASFGIFLFTNYKKKRSLKNFDADAEYKNAPQFLKEFCANQLSSVPKQMNGFSIDAITECAHITNLQKQAANATITAVKTLGWAAIGVKAKYQTAQNTSYLVLSGNSLHYLFYEEGEIKQHLVLDEYRMQNAKIEQTSGLDKVARMGSVAGRKTQKLIFDIDGKSMEILFYDRIANAPEGMLNGTDFHLLHAKGEIIGKHFVENIKTTYPSLSWVTA